MIYRRFVMETRKLFPVRSLQMKLSVMISFYKFSNAI